MIVEPDFKTPREIKGFVKIPCPVCGEPITFPAEFEGFDETDGISLVDVGLPEPSCDCREKISKNGYKEKFDGWDRSSFPTRARYRKDFELLRAYDDHVDFRVDNSELSDWSFSL